MNILVIGATSTIAQHVIRKFAQDGASLCLVARDPLALKAVADDARVRGSTVLRTDVFDAADLADVRRCIDGIRGWAIAFDVVLIAHGWLGDETACAQDLALAERSFNINGASACLFALGLVKELEREKKGCLAVISSVAALRGRSRNCIYGSSKAMINVLMQGLRQRLHGTGVRCITILPGMVDTAMTAHMPKTRLFARPEKVAADIYRVVVNGGPSVVFVPGYWRILMFVIQRIPEALFVRMSF